ncbi:MAG: sulfotransferase [Acidobacteriota bacterium]|nr:sulfotransferase [Acidobacteriota bacterium]
MNHPTAVIIGGHPRSGTTLLNTLCNTHPDIVMSFEYRSFVALDMTLPIYLKRLGDPSKKKPFLQKSNGNKSADREAGIHFHEHMTTQLKNAAPEIVRLQDVIGIYQSAFPEARVIGDKYPRYVFHLDKLAAYSDLRRIIIYRDPRDVARSALEKAATDWKGKPFGKSLDTAWKVATHWVKSMDMMERYAPRVHTLRYESLIRDPRTAMSTLGRYLGVDPDGFTTSKIHDSSIGKHRDELTREQIHAIEEIAGPTMRRWGYTA